MVFPQHVFAPCPPLLSRRAICRLQSCYEFQPPVLSSPLPFALYDGGGTSNLLCCSRSEAAAFFSRTNSPVAPLDRFGRPRHARRAGQQRPPDSRRDGDFFQWRPPDHGRNWPRVICCAPHRGHYFWLDLRTSWPRSIDRRRARRSRSHHDDRFRHPGNRVARRPLRNRWQRFLRRRRREPHHYFRRTGFRARLFDYLARGHAARRLATRPRFRRSFLRKTNRSGARSCFRRSQPRSGFFAARSRRSSPIDRQRLRHNLQGSIGSQESRSGHCRPCRRKSYSNFQLRRRGKSRAFRSRRPQTWQFSDFYSTVEFRNPPALGPSQIPTCVPIFSASLPCRPRIYARLLELVSTGSARVACPFSIVASTALALINESMVLCAFSSFLSASP